MVDYTQLSDDELEAELRARLMAQAPDANPVQPFKSQVVGFIDGATAPVGNALGWVNRGLRSVGAPAIPGVDERIAYQRARMDANQGEAGSFAGQVGVGLATAPTKLASGVQGGIQGASQSRADNLGDLAVDTAWGVGGGIFGDKAVKAIGAAISPRVRPAVARLKELGAKMTPGEVIGGRAKVLEDKMMSWPIIGDAIAGARRGGQEAFEEIAVNKVLEPIGEVLPKGKAGREAIRYAGDRLSDSYSKLVPLLKGKIDRPFVTRVLAVKARANLPEDQLAKFDDVLQRELASAFDPKTGEITGRRFKQIEERLRDISSAWRKSDNPFERDLGSAVGDVREQLFAMLARQNPKAAARLRATNKGWRNLVAIENAATTAEGVVTPGRLSVGVRQASATARKRSFARGTEPLSQLAQDGVDVLSNRTPNSFTTDRMLLAGGAAGAAGTGAALLNPAVAAPGLLAAPYLPGGRQVAQWLLTGRQSAPLRMIGRGVRQMSPLGAAMVPPLLARPQD